MSKAIYPQNAQVVDEPRLIDAAKTEGMAGASRWTLWRWEREQPPRFPKSLKYGGKRFWVEQEVRAWVAARMAERG